MKGSVKLAFFISMIIFFCQCEHNARSNQGKTEKGGQRIETSEFVLEKSDSSSRLLVLFPCFSCNAAQTQVDFPIADLAVQEGISVMFMNFSERLWLEEKMIDSLVQIIDNALLHNNLSPKHIVIGGFSSGGNIALTLANELRNSSSLIPSAVFAVDPPIDLNALYTNSQRRLHRDVPISSKNEATHIIHLLQKQFDSDSLEATQIERISPFTAETKNMSQLRNLKSIPLRFYAEPDTAWWMSYNQSQPKELNAYSIKLLQNLLIDNSEDWNLEYIVTENKGFRSNGIRHPHSWSIVDQTELVNWIKSL
jgi:hypothetical protein